MNIRSWPRRLKSPICYTVFWGWNVTFLVITFLGIMPTIGMTLSYAVLNGDVPFDFLISCWLLIIVPCISVWIALKYFQKKPEVLIRLFYGVEAPLFLLCLLRLFVLRELTLASAFLIGSAVLAAFIYGGLLICGVKNKPLKTSYALGLSAYLLVMAIYIGALLAIYAVPIGWMTLSALIGVEWVNTFFDALNAVFEVMTSPDMWMPVLIGFVWWIPFIIIFFFFSVALFVGSPIALVCYYGKMWWTGFQDMPSKKHAVAITASIVLVWCGLFVVLDKQPQGQVFSWFENQNTVDIATQRSNLLQHDADVRAGLLNAYLHDYRYLGVKEDVNQIQELYESAFGSGKGESYAFIENIYKGLLSPMLYKGQDADDKKAAKLYAQMFDAPIQRGERQAITHALSATFDQDQSEAGLLNINQQQVLLKEQDIVTESHGAVIDVEIHEAYENQTSDRQEIYYYFSLPTNAAITGLWLGNTADRTQRKKFTVAPRGAAQSVYKSEVYRRVDPALLEQVGPQQYRLRAFPIPPRRFSKTVEPTEQPKMHLWLNYSVLNQGSGSMFPTLLERRNIYWGEETHRTYNGKALLGESTWLPPFSADAREVSEDEDSTVSLRVGDSVYKASPAHVELEVSHLQPIKAAILLDTSYSMGKHKDSLDQAIQDVRERSNTVDVYAQTFGKQLQKIKGQETLGFFGTLSDSDLWNTAASLKGYDVVFVMTDEGSYELAPSKPALMASDHAIWFVHVNHLAPAYEDKVMRKLMGQGGVATSGTQAWLKYMQQRVLAANQEQDGQYVWSFTKEAKGTDVLNKPVSPIAAKMLIRHLTTHPDELGIGFLDDVHGLAKSQGIVTPYSSMIVLISERQKEALQKAAQGKDRFNRSVESGVEVLSKPADILVFAAPEPEEWLLIVIAISLLSWLHMRRRRALSKS